jgi:hypothetical protein
MKLNDMLVFLITMHVNMPGNALGTFRKDRRDKELLLFMFMNYTQSIRVETSHRPESKAGYTEPIP